MAFFLRTEMKSIISKIGARAIGGRFTWKGF